MIAGTPWVASCTVTVDADDVETCSGPEAGDALSYAAFGDHGTREFFTHVRFHKHEDDKIVVHLLVELYARSADEATEVLEDGRPRPRSRSRRWPRSPARRRRPATTATEWRPDARSRDRSPRDSCGAAATRSTATSERRGAPVALERRCGGVDDAADAARIWQRRRSWISTASQGTVCIVLDPLEVGRRVTPPALASTSGTTTDAAIARGRRLRLGRASGRWRPRRSSRQSTPVGVLGRDLALERRRDEDVARHLEDLRAADGLAAAGSPRARRARPPSASHAPGCRARPRSTIAAA